MGMIESMFGRPGSPWYQYIEEEKPDEELISIIKRFYIADNISMDKFLMNIAAYSDSTEWSGFYFDMYPDVKCTPSLPFAADPLHRGIKIPVWLIVAYPDIIKWMFNNPYQRTLYHPPYIINDEAQPEFYRALIQRYLFEGNKLECAEDLNS
jgi:hypothetical protein